MRRRTDDQYIDPDDNIARDGETVSVRVNLTDTVRFDEHGREHFVRMADARRKARPPDDDDDDDGGDDTMDASTINAADYRPGFRFARPRAQRRSVCDARDEYVRQLTDAWRRTPTRTTRDAAEPDMGTRPDELMMRRHMFGAPGLPDPSTSHAAEFQGEQAQRRRDAAWVRYRDGLANAWRGGRTDPRRAAQEESRLERWKAPLE
jgi:hypothetical protein